MNVGRGSAGKVPVVGMRDRNGQVVAKVANATDSATLQGAVLESTALGSTIVTDEHRSYIGLCATFTHRTVNHSAKQFVDGIAHTNGMESVWAVQKRGFYGIYHSFSEKHLTKYVDEFVFRLNESNCAIDTVDRLESLIKGTVNIRLTYKCSPRKNLLDSKQKANHTISLHHQTWLKTKEPQMTTITQTPESITQTKKPFVEIIEDWEKRNILQTLTREEREKEYQIAVEKLHDFIEEEALKEDYDTMQILRRVRIEMSLRDRVLTKEEQFAEENEFCDD